MPVRRVRSPRAGSAARRSSMSARSGPSPTKVIVAGRPRAVSSVRTSRQAMGSLRSTSPPTVTMLMLPVSSPPDGLLTAPWGSTMQGTTLVGRPRRRARIGAARYSQTAVTRSGRARPWPTTGMAARRAGPSVSGLVRPDQCSVWTQGRVRARAWSRAVSGRSVLIAMECRTSVPLSAGRSRSAAWATDSGLEGFMGMDRTRMPSRVRWRAPSSWWGGTRWMMRTSCPASRIAALSRRTKEPELGARSVGSQVVTTVTRMPPC